MDGDPQAGRDPFDAAWSLSRQARQHLTGSARHQSPPRESLLLDYARERGRISSTEGASLLGASANTARTILDDLERDGSLRSGRDQRRGRGFFYVPVQAP